MTKNAILAIFLAAVLLLGFSTQPLGDRYPTMQDRETPTATPTQDRQTPTATPSPVSGNLLVHPDFTTDGHVCPTHGVREHPYWPSEFFNFGGNPGNALFPSEDDCLARSKSSLPSAPSDGEIPNGGSGKLWQINPTDPYSVITFGDIHAEHEDGDIWHRVYGCNDIMDTDCTLLFETDLRQPQLTQKNVCHVYKQIVEASVDGIVNHRVEHAVDGCTTQLPAPVTFTVPPFGQFPYLKAEVEVIPLLNGQGQSGYETDEWTLTIE